jgi:DNA helicase-2/ATP-dependent DNA helicase PcrA
MSDPAERLFAEIFADYQRSLQRANAFDFDDLIAQTVYLFRAFPHVADTYRRASATSSSTSTRTPTTPSTR